MAIEEVFTRIRVVKRWRGRKFCVARWRIGYLINIPAQKFVYFSRVSDPLDYTVIE